MVQGIRAIDRKLDGTPAQNQKGHQVTSNVPYSRNSLFVGRDQELVKLHQQLVRDEKPEQINWSTKVSVIHSMGGMGKTQLALEYTYRYRHCFDFIFWLPAEKGPELAQSFTRLLDLISEDGTLRDDVAIGQAQQVKWWLERTGRLL